MGKYNLSGLLYLVQVLFCFESKGKELYMRLNRKENWENGGIVKSWG